MATKVHMEALSPTMEEGQVVKWLRSEGDAVGNGDVLAEVETDKATMELVARGDGILRKILVPEGGTAPVGEVIAVIAGADEDISALVGDAGGKADAAEPEAAKAGGEGTAVLDDETARDTPSVGEETAASGEAASEREPGPPEAVSSEGDGRIRASPLARRLAGEAGIELESVEGSGPGGRIVKRDIEAAVEEGVRPSAPAASTAAAPLLEGSGPEWEDLKLSQMRKTIARRLAESIGPIPHFFLTIDVDMTRAAEARTAINEHLAERGVKVSYNDMVLQATARALREHPDCNAHWLGDGIRRFRDAHLGVAVAVDDGLITPVIRNADRKSLATIASEVREMAGRAREKRLRPEEYSGATFSVSNLGMFGIESFTAVINPPEAGILAVGAVEERPVVVDGELDLRLRMRITMSCDHRVIDGAQGSRFLATLRSFLEHPARMLA